MAKKTILWGMLVMALAFGFVFISCDTDGGGESNGGEEGLLEVTHVNGFQGRLPDGSLIEIEVNSTPAASIMARVGIADGSYPFTLYIKGLKEGTGELIISNGSITAITSSTNERLIYIPGEYNGYYYRNGGVGYKVRDEIGGERTYSLKLRAADNKVNLHWVVYGGRTKNDFDNHAKTYNYDAYLMYINHPDPNDQGHYPNTTGYDTVNTIYYRSGQDHPNDAPPISTLNEAIKMLNAGKDMGVGAYVSRGNLIAYYFTRNIETSDEIINNGGNGGNGSGNSKPSYLSSDASYTETMSKLNEIISYCNSHPGNETIQSQAEILRGNFISYQTTWSYLIPGINSYIDALR